MKLDEISLGKIDVSEANVRKHDREIELDDLAKSIERWGVLQPVVVFPKDERFELVVGQRRFLACKKLGQKKIPAVVVKTPAEVDAKVLSISENIQRVGLTRPDEVEIVGFLYEHCGKSVAKVVKMLGKSDGWVRGNLKLGQYGSPALMKAMAEKRIKKGDAIKVAMIAGDDPKKTEELVKEIGKLTPPEKVRLEDIGKRKPKAPTRELISEAKRARKLDKLSIWLTPRMAEALDNAAVDTGIEREDIGKTALMEYLSRKGYLTVV